MAVLETVSPGDPTSAAIFNKAINAWVNVLGVTDDAQVNLGRLPLPWLSADPSTVSGLAWMRSNHGASGRLYIRQSGLTVPYLPYRQRVKSATLGTFTTLTPSVMPTYGDVTGLSVSITTTGGRLRITLVSADGAQGGDIRIYTPSASSPLGSFRPVVGAVALSPLNFGLGLAGVNQALILPCSAFSWADYLTVAGTYTVKIQAAVAVSGQQIFLTDDIALLVEEYGD